MSGGPPFVSLRPGADAPNRVLLAWSGFRFRWKGENVATSEVADILTAAPCLSEANVYGVKVEGRKTDLLHKAVQNETAGLKCPYFAPCVSKR